MIGNQKESAEALAIEIEKETSAEIAVFTVYSLNGRGLQQYANQVVEKWKIGKKEKNNGVLIFIAVTERQILIWPGLGLKRALPEEKCRKIINSIMGPKIKDGKYGDGIYSAMLEIKKAIIQDVK